MSKIVVVSYVMETTLGEFQVLVRKKILKNALKRFLCTVSRCSAKKVLLKISQKS